MAVTLTTGMEFPDQVRPFRGGLLDTALELPEGWENTGVVVPFYTCGWPIVRDKCLTLSDTPRRDELREFQPFLVEQGSTCSTIGPDNQEAHARGRLEGTLEWALGRQLQSDIADTGNPRLDDASKLSTVTDVVVAVAALEQMAADSGYGTEWWLHTTPYMAAYLRRYHLITPDGRTPAGGRWVISPGYADPGDVHPIWVTGPVWAGVEDPTVRSVVGHRTNDRDAWAIAGAMVAFDPCILWRIDVTPCSSCPGGGGMTPDEVQAIVDAQTATLEASNDEQTTEITADVQAMIDAQTTALNTANSNQTVEITDNLQFVVTTMEGLAADINENTDTEVQASTATIVGKLDELFPESP